ncbi:hypothetical protein A2U01_0081646, partial [Trifolium medium]|nr:hypothetical protein [Trifolium medium]
SQEPRSTIVREENQENKRQEPHEIVELVSTSQEDPSTNDLLVNIVNMLQQQPHASITWRSHRTVSR